jgi:hypothetical protein
MTIVNRSAGRKALARHSWRDNMKSTRTRLLATAVATGAVALAAPVAGASAAIPTLPGLGTYSGYTFPTIPGLGGSSANAVGGNQIGTAGCVGTNRPSVGGNNGSTSAQSCGALLNFSGPQIGQIASVIGPTIIGSPNVIVKVSAGSITDIGSTP